MELNYPCVVAAPKLKFLSQPIPGSCNCHSRAVGESRKCVVGQGISCRKDPHVRPIEVHTAIDEMRDDWGVCL
jgi:hypothetical protein